VIERGELSFLFKASLSHWKSSVSSGMVLNRKRAANNECAEGDMDMDTPCASSSTPIPPPGPDCPSNNPSDDSHGNKSTKQLVQDKENRRGVLYLSRVPPYMQADKVRDYMSQFGEVGRIYLTPEDKTAYKNRARTGGNKKMKFADGWIEFMDKRIAKRVAESLNGTPVGGKKRHNFWRDDMWNLKYLSGFKWHHLTEFASYKKSVRQDKLNAQMSQLKKENNFYLEQVERAKRFEKRDAKAAAAPTSSETV